MSAESKLYEAEKAADVPDPDEIPIRERKVVTQPYDVGVESMIHQIDSGTIFLRPLSERPEFQRRYVWNDKLASKLIESILLKVPIPPCYLSQNDDYEQDVIDGQQRIYSIYRFCKNHFKLTGLEVLTELNGVAFHDLNSKFQRQILTHIQRFVLITNESHPEVKFEVFERLNTNTVPLTPQELRNCVYRGPLLTLLKELVLDDVWLKVLRKGEPDKRMRDEELLLRFFAFHIGGLEHYRTPQKHWLNEVAKQGRKYSDQKIGELRNVWSVALHNSLLWFSPEECFRSSIVAPPKAINRAVFDLVSQTAASTTPDVAKKSRTKLRRQLGLLLADDEFQDLISRSVDHTKRTKRRFELWEEAMAGVL
ncbi:MAG: DUF262 domain-containing protein [Ktedonobacteraceae bacterium]